MEFNKQYRSNKLIATLVFIIFVIVFTVIFCLNLSERRDAEVKSNLICLNSEAKYIFNENVNSLFGELEKTAGIISEFDSIKSDQAIEFIENQAYTSGFDKLLIITINAEGYTSDRNIIDLAGKQFATDALAGKTSVSELLRFSDYENEYIAFSCPIFSGEKVIGAISALITPEYFGEIADTIRYDSKNVYIINEKGSILNSTILSEKYGNFFTALSSFEIADNYSINTVENDLFTGQENIIEYNDGSTDLLAYYSQLDINNWFIITEYTKDFIFSGYSFHNNMLFYFSGMLLVLSIPYAVFMLLNRQKYLNVWKTNSEALSFIYHNSSEIFFEINPSSFDISFSDGFAQRYGSGTKITNIKDKKLICDMIHKDDSDKLSAFTEGIMSGNKINEIAMRFRTGLDNFEQCRIIASSVFDGKGKVIGIIGRLYTSEDESRQLTGSEEMTRRDALTGLFNKLGTKTRIDDYLCEKSGERGSFLLAEIADYETLKISCKGENLDKSIAKAAENMQKFFRSSDIIGRTCENEFTVMMKKIKNIELITEKALEISKIFNNAARQNSINEKFTVNIGISSYPDDAADFTGLYKKSHKALSMSKSAKNGIFFYEDDGCDPALPEDVLNAED
ncbi:MAG: diguanylate cyclase [Oscillospiraceae bacterium]|jgi:diguanylate cyclase (GGDEF)-like protein